MNVCMNNAVVNSFCQQVLMCPGTEADDNSCQLLCLFICPVSYYPNIHSWNSQECDSTGFLLSNMPNNFVTSKKN